jgi:hypothetical protein
VIALLLLGATAALAQEPPDPLLGHEMHGAVDDDRTDRRRIAFTTIALGAAGAGGGVPLLLDGDGFSLGAGIALLGAGALELSLGLAAAVRAGRSSRARHRDLSLDPDGWTRSERIRAERARRGHRAAKALAVAFLIGGAFTAVTGFYGEADGIAGAGCVVAGEALAGLALAIAADRRELRYRDRLGAFSFTLGTLHLTTRF